jgi:glucokinase
MDLIADIGATSTRCGLVNDRGEIVKREAFANETFSSPTSLLRRFLAEGRATDRPLRAAIAIAAPVLGDRISMLNRDWHLSQSELSADLDVSRLIVVNDFAAVAWSLPSIGAPQRLQIGSGMQVPHAPMGVVGPGSGLGVGALVPAAADGWAVVTGEGGHVSLAAATRIEARIVDAVRAEHEHCSAERLLSGPGLVRIYVELAKIRERASTLTDPAEVTALAARGEPLASETMSIFFALLGSVAGDLALTIGAHGGIFVAGGIVPRIPDMLRQSPFRERFVSKGRYRGYLERIPTCLITAEVPAFIGLTRLLGYR